MGNTRRTCNTTIGETLPLIVNFSGLSIKYRPCVADSSGWNPTITSVYVGLISLISNLNIELNNRVVQSVGSLYFINYTWAVVQTRNLFSRLCENLGILDGQRRNSAENIRKHRSTISTSRGCTKVRNLILASSVSSNVVSEICWIKHDFPKPRNFDKLVLNVSDQKLGGMKVTLLWK